MAQVTESLIASQRARHARGEHVNLTINEEEQLLWAWEELQHLRRLDIIRTYGPRYECMDILISRGLGTYSAGFHDQFHLDEGMLRQLSREDSSKICGLISTKIPLGNPELDALIVSIQNQTNEAGNG